MVAFLSDEWFAAVRSAAEDLPSLDGLSFSFDIEVPETPNGKVRGHGEVVDGRLSAFELGKAPTATDVSFIAKNARAMPIVRGEQHPLVGYMLGHLKIDGAYELVVDHLANRGDRAAWSRFGAAVASATDD